MTSFVDVVRPSAKSYGILYDALCVLGGSLLLALFSQISFTPWFTCVPITLQTLAVMLISGLLGSRKGAYAVLAYLAEGAMGLPFFAGGACGLARLMGPTGGYLFSFVVAAFLMGWLLEKGWKESYKKTCAALVLGTVVVFALGACWLAFFVGASHAWVMGVYPFLMGATLKILVAAALIPSGWKALSLGAPR